MTRLARALLFCLLILVIPAFPLAGQKAKDVSLETSDGVKIAATWYPGDRGKPGLVLIHQLGHNRSDWRSFAFDCQEKGYYVLAIDLRGHGQSTEGKNGRKLDFQKFTETDYGDMKFDVAAGVQWLLKEGSADPKKIGIVGASIGANHALLFAATGKTPIKTVVLLSPGIEYRGVNVTSAAQRYAGTALFVAMTGDEYSVRSSKELAQSAGSNAAVKIFSGKDHGTNMFGSSDLEKFIFEWLAKNLE